MKLSAFVGSTETVYAVSVRGDVPTPTSPFFVGPRSAVGSASD